MASKVIGDVVSVFGIFLMVVGFGIIPFEIGFLKGVSGNIVAYGGVGLIIVGVVMSLNKEGRSRGKRGGKNEVPIYEGVGKKRRVVGYRAD